MRYVIGEKQRQAVRVALKAAGELELANELLLLPDLPKRAQDLYLDGYHYGFSQAKSGGRRDGEIAWESYMLVE